MMCGVIAGLGLMGCGGGGGSGAQSKEPELQLIFPAAYSAIEASSITVRGAASANTKISAISINGVPVTSNDAFATWTAQLSLQPGRNALVAEMTKEGAAEPQSMSLGHVESNALLTNPAYVAASSDGATLYLLEGSKRRIVKVDRATQQRTVLSDGSTPNDESRIGNTEGMILDEAGNQLVLLNRLPEGGLDRQLLAVSLVDGQRSEIVRLAQNTGGYLKWSDGGLVLDTATRLVYLLSSDGSKQNLLSTPLDPSDLAFGELSVVTEQDFPPHEIYANQYNTDSAYDAMTMDVAGQRIIVLDQAGNVSEISLDPLSLGDTQQLMSVSLPENPQALAYGGGDLVYLYDQIWEGYGASDDSSDIYELDLQAETETRLHDGNRDGQPLRNSASLAWDSQNNQLLVAAGSHSQVLLLNPGDNTLSTYVANLYSDLAGTHETLELNHDGAAVDWETNRYWVFDSSDLVLLNLVTGEREVVWENEEYDVTEINYQEDAGRLVLSGRDGDRNPSLISLDTDTYSVTTLIGGEPEDGNASQEIEDWIYLGDNNSIILVDDEPGDGAPSSFFYFDLQSKEQTRIEMDFSAASTFEEAEEMALSPDQTTLCFTDDDSTARGLYCADLTADGAKPVTTVSNDLIPAHQAGALLVDDPESMAFSSDGQYVYIGDNNSDTLLRVNVVTGERTDVLPDTSDDSAQNWGERLKAVDINSELQLLLLADENSDKVMLMDETTHEWIIIHE